jgi:hypothetical protein
MDTVSCGLVYCGALSWGCHDACGSREDTRMAELSEKLIRSTLELEFDQAADLGVGVLAALDAREHQS